MRASGWIGVAALSVAGMMLALPASAQFNKPEDAVKYRKAGYTVMGVHFSRIGAVVKGEAPYGPSVARDAKIVEAMSTLPFTAFGPGTDVGDTRAKPEIWTDRAGFDAAAEKMQKAVAELSKVAASGDEGKLKAAFGEVGKTCKGCHDEYRSK